MAVFTEIIENECIISSIRIWAAEYIRPTILLAQYYFQIQL